MDDEFVKLKSLLADGDAQCKPLLADGDRQFIPPVTNDDAKFNPFVADEFSRILGTDVGAETVKSLTANGVGYKPAAEFVGFLIVRNTTDTTCA